MSALRGYFIRGWQGAGTRHLRYKPDTDGSISVEFSILVVPYLAIMFAIIELALIFFTGAVLTQALSDTGRMVRVGSFQGCGTASEFKTLVCNRMSNLMNCQANLRVDLYSASDFQSVVMSDPGTSGLDPDDDEAEIMDGDFTDTDAGEPVVLRGTFYYPLAIPTVLTRLENLDGSGRRVISVSTAFRNEPFPDADRCSSTILEELGADGVMEIVDAGGSAVIL